MNVYRTYAGMFQIGEKDSLNLKETLVYFVVLIEPPTIGCLPKAPSRMTIVVTGFQ